MRRWATILVLLTAAGLLGLAAHAAPPAEPGPVTVGGLRLGPVPEILYTHIPDLPRGRGVVVKSIGVDSPLGQAGLRRFDVLLACDGVPLRDGKHLAGMLSESGPGQPHRLVLFRAGRQMTLTLGQPDPAADPVPKSVLKPGGPPAVSVDYHPLDKGKLKVRFVFYSNSGKLERVTCSGSLDQIENNVRQLGEQQRMPARVQDLAEVALKRIRTLNAAVGQ